MRHQASLSVQIMVDEHEYLKRLSKIMGSHTVGKASMEAV
jgi:hypothetical protein